jgi:acetolactate synthase small subunit
MISLKKYFLKKQFQKKLAENEIHRVVSQNEIKTVGIITSEEISKWLNIKEEVEKILNLENVEIYSFGIQKNNKDNSFHFFSKKDFNWKGNICKPEFKSFIDKPFDLFIGYVSKNNLFVESAILQSKALFKVGISDVNQQLYDLEIAETPSKTESFFLELKKYLTILRKLKK